MGLLAELARGITYRDKRGQVPKIYDRPPNEFAIKQLNEYQYGKPRQVLEHAIDEGAMGRVMAAFADSMVQDPGQGMDQPEGDFLPGESS